MESNWDKRYLDLAAHIATWSKDPKKKVGAVVTEGNYIRGVGFNGFPRGIEDTDSWLANRKIKLQVMVHAEVNALIASGGQGDRIYIYPCLPCTQCLGQIIQNGIEQIVVPKTGLRASKWHPQFVLQLASEAKLEIKFMEEI